MNDETIPEQSEGETPAGEVKITEAPEQPAEDASGEPTEAEKADVEAKAEKQRAYQDRAKTRRILERAKKLEEENAQLKAAQAQPTDKAPVLDDFDDYETYLVARAEYAADAKISKMQAERETQDRQRRELEAQQEASDRWEGALVSAREKYADFDDVAFGDVRITEQMSVAVMDHDDGTEIAYYLGKHPDEALQIAKLSPIKQLTMIGAIGERLKERPTRPPPPRPVSRGSTSRTTAPTELSDELPLDQWLKVRNKQLGRS